MKGIIFGLKYIGAPTLWLRCAGCHPSHPVHSRKSSQFGSCCDILQNDDIRSAPPIILECFWVVQHLIRLDPTKPQTMRESPVSIAESVEEIARGQPSTCTHNQLWCIETRTFSSIEAPQTDAYQHVCS